MAYSKKKNKKKSTKYMYGGKKKNIHRKDSNMDYLNPQRKPMYVNPTFANTYSPYLGYGYQYGGTLGTDAYYVDTLPTRDLELLETSYSDPTLQQMPIQDPSRFQGQNIMGVPLDAQGMQDLATQKPTTGNYVAGAVTAGTGIANLTQQEGPVGVEDTVDVVQDTVGTIIPIAGVFDGISDTGQELAASWAPEGKEEEHADWSRRLFEPHTMITEDWIDADAEKKRGDKKTSAVYAAKYGGNIHQTNPNMSTQNLKEVTVAAPSNLKGYEGYFDSPAEYQRVIDTYGPNIIQTKGQNAYDPNVSTDSLMINPHAIPGFDEKAKEVFLKMHPYAKNINDPKVSNLWKNLTVKPSELQAFEETGIVPSSMVTISAMPTKRTAVQQNTSNIPSRKSSSVNTPPTWTGESIGQLPMRSPKEISSIENRGLEQSPYGYANQYNSKTGKWTTPKLTANPKAIEAYREREAFKRQNTGELTPGDIYTSDNKFTPKFTSTVDADALKQTTGFDVSKIDPNMISSFNYGGNMYNDYAYGNKMYNDYQKGGKADFEPHMMYDPETGKGYKADKVEDHERMKKLGYLHKNEMAYGGNMFNEYKTGGGYTVTRSNNRKGKTHKVVRNSDGKTEYYGYPGMGEKENSKLGKKAFRSRHAKNLKNNPFFRAYANATWEYGGVMNEYAEGGKLPKEVLRSRVESHMSKEEADNYVNNYRTGGKQMIKRADGSYSPRGLWDNIRAKAKKNKKSGTKPKKPTKKMLEQERKITANEKAYGGNMFNNNGFGVNTMNQIPVNEFGAGGTHEENLLGGIPQGIGANGLPNLVEQGELKMPDPRDPSGNSSFIVSAQPDMKITKAIAEENGLSKNYIGKTVRKAADMLLRKNELFTREGDTVKQNSIDQDIIAFMNAHEQLTAMKEAKENAKFQEKLGNLAEEFPQQMDAMMPPPQEAAPQGMPMSMPPMGMPSMAQYGGNIHQYNPNLVKKAKEANPNLKKDIKLDSTVYINPGTFSKEDLKKEAERKVKSLKQFGGNIYQYNPNLTNNYATGGEVVDAVGSTLYGIGEGVLDTLTFGATDALTDKGYDWLRSEADLADVEYDEEGNPIGSDMGAGLRGIGNTTGAIGGAFINPSAAGTAVSQGAKGVGDALGASGNEDLEKIGKGVKVAGQVAGTIVGANANVNVPGEAAAGEIVTEGGNKVVKGLQNFGQGNLASESANVSKAGEMGINMGMDMATAQLGKDANKNQREDYIEQEEEKRVKNYFMAKYGGNIHQYNPNMLNASLYTPATYPDFKDTPAGQYMQQELNVSNTPNPQIQEGINILLNPFGNNDTAINENMFNDPRFGQTANYATVNTEVYDNNDAVNNLATRPVETLEENIEERVLMPMNNNSSIVSEKELDNTFNYDPTLSNTSNTTRKQTFGNFAAQMAPIATNLGMGLLGQPDELNLNYVNPITLKRLSAQEQIKNLGYDIADFKKKIRGAAGRQSGIYLGNLQSAFNKFQRAKGKIYSDVARKNIGIDAREVAMNLNVDMQNKSKKDKEEQWNKLSKVAKQNLISTAMGQIAQYAQAQEANRIAEDYNEMFSDRYGYDYSSFLERNKKKKKNKKA